MTLFNSLRYWLRITLAGGPVGLAYVLRLAWLRRRIAYATTCLAREKEVHREQVAALNEEINQLIGRQYNANICAGQFWDWCQRQDVTQQRQQQSLRRGARS
jgi:hypothetical protein